jgi:hypothetical protein
VNETNEGRHKKQQQEGHKKGVGEGPERILDSILFEARRIAPLAAGKDSQEIPAIKNGTVSRMLIGVGLDDPVARTRSSSQICASVKDFATAGSIGRRSRSFMVPRAGRVICCNASSGARQSHAGMLFVSYIV